MYIVSFINSQITFQISHVSLDQDLQKETFRADDLVASLVLYFLANKLVQQEFFDLIYYMYIYIS